MSTVSNLTLYFLQGAIQAFSQKLAPIEAFSYAVNQEGAGLNDIVRVPYVINTGSAADFTYAGGYSSATGVVIGKPVTLSTLKYKMWNIDDSEILRLSPEVLKRLGGQAGNQVASDVTSTFFNNVTASNFPLSGAYSASAYSTQAAFVSLQKQANQNKWTDERHLIVGPTLYSTIVSNTTLVNYAYGSPEVVRDGKLPKYFGFTPHMVTNLDETNTELIQGFATCPQGIIAGMAYHRAQEEIPYFEKQMIKDELTGVVLGYRAWGDWSKASVNRVIDCLAGSAVADNKAVIRLLTTP